jgi:hypothetical protein
MSTALRVVMLATLWGFLGVGYATGDAGYYGIAVGIGIVLVASLAETWTRTLLAKRPVPLCGQNPLGDHEHACALPHGHPRDMHACRHGDCSWGSYAVNPDSVK